MLRKKTVWLVVHLFNINAHLSLQDPALVVVKDFISYCITILMVAKKKVAER